MPHIVLENTSAVKDAFNAITPFAERTEKGMLKVIDKFINSSEQVALIEALAIENGKNQNFFIQISRKETSLTVRLLPMTDPEKTDGVKTIMAIIAKQIKNRDEKITYGKTNLQDFLIN
jgi:aspartyl aminopeptidase